MFHQQNIGKADVTMLIMKQVTLNAEMSDEKKIGEICTNCGTLSMHDILFSISTRVLMNASFFLCGYFQPVLNNYFEGILLLFFFMYNFRGSAKV